MKIIFISTLMIASTLSMAQSIDYSAYENVSNESFKKFLSFFNRKSLPLTTSDIFSSNILSDDTKSGLSDDMVNSFLKKEEELIPIPLYIEEVETGERRNVYGEFIPLFKLPTKGSYVTIVLLQREWATENKIVTILSYDMQGNFVDMVGFLMFNGLDSFISGEMDASANFHSKYLYPSYEGDPQDCNPCVHTYKEIVYTPLPTGIMEVSSNNSLSGTFRYSPQQSRFIEVH